MAAVVAVLAPASALGAPSDLDPTFGSGGVATITTNRSATQGSPIVQPDGRVLVAAVDSATGYVVVERFTAAGAPDTSFGTNGEIVTDLKPAFGRAAFADAGAGTFQIVTGSQTTGTSTLERFAADGTRTAKVTVTVPGQLIWPTAAVVRPDGATYVAAKFDLGKSVYAFGVMRIKGNGLDTSFNGKGYQTTKIGSYSRPLDIALTQTATGSDVITVAGSYGYPGFSSTDTAVARYTQSGAIDTKFGSNGVKTVDFSGAGASDWANGLVVSPTGAVSLAGASGTTGYVARLTSTGAVDTSFGAQGVVRGGFGPSGWTYAAVDILMDSAGQLLTTGGLRDPTTKTTKWTASRFTTAGAFDPSFAAGGTAQYTPCANTIGDTPTGLALTNGRIHIAGDCGSSGTPAVARLLTVPPFTGNATLSLSPGAAAAGHERIDTSALDPASVLKVVDDLASAAMRSNPMRSNPMRSNAMRSNPMRSNPMRSNPIRAHAIASKILLSDLPLLNTTWQAVLGGTFDQPLQTLTLEDALNSGAPGVNALTIADIDLARTPLRDVSAGAMLLGLQPLAALPAPPAGWCGYLAGKQLDCTNGVDPTSTTLVDLELGGDDLSTYFSAGVDLVGVNLGSGVDAAPLTFIKLTDIELSLTPIGAVPASRFPSLFACGSSCTGTVAQQQAADPSGFSSASLGALLAQLPVPELQHVTLGQLMRGLVAPELIPYEQAPVGNLLAAADIRSTGLQHATVDFTVDCAQAANLAADLAPGVDARIVPGSATLTVGGAAKPVSGHGPIDLTGACQGATGSVSPTLAFDIEPGSDLGPNALTVTISSDFGSLQATAPVTVDDSRDPGDSIGQTRTLGQNEILTGHIANGTDVDFYRFPAPPAGTRVSFVLSHLPADFDLTVLGPPGSLPTAPMRSNAMRSNPMRSNPVTDASQEPVDAGAPADTLQDIPLQVAAMRSNPMRSNSINRGAHDESATVVTTSADQGKDLIVAVTPFSGASSPKPYYLTAKVTPAPPTPPCQSQPALSTGAGNSLPANVPSDTEALILVNQQRLAASSSAAQAANVAAKAQALAQATHGLVVPVDVPSTASAYAALDAQPCSVAAANGVVTAINDVVDTIRQRGGGLPGLRSILLVGSDRIVPQARVSDQTVLSNESDYADDAAIGGNDSGQSRAAREGYLLSDDPYGDFDPAPDLFVPDVALGRLVESPQDIVAQIDAFLTSNGRLQPTRTFVTGYDFLADGAQRTFDALRGAAPGTLLQDSWTANDARDGANLPGAAFTSINGHYDHYRALPGLPGRLLDDTEVTPPAGSVLFTVGCHAGLNLDVAVGGSANQAKLSDWPERMSASQALYAASTGYGYGDTDAVAYSERLMADYAAQLASGNVTAGQALMVAKQSDAAGLTSTDDYWDKALMETTFYGIPMYRLGAGGGQAPASVLDPPSGTGALRTSSTQTIDPAFDPPHTSSRGTYWTANGQDPLVVQHRPIEPRVTTDITNRNAAPVHGAIIETLATHEQSPVDHVVALPTVDLSAHEPEPDGATPYFPAQLVTAGPAQTENGRRDLLTLAAGQARDTVQRFVDHAVVRVYRSNSTDYDPNVITRVDGMVTGGGFSITVDVLGGDEDTGVVLYRTDASQAWNSVPLGKVAPGRMGAGGPLPNGATQIDEAMVWVVDTSGNTAFSNSKVVGYSFLPVPTPPGAPQVVFSPAPPANGYYSTPPTVSLNPGTHGSAQFEYSVDGGTWQPYSQPFTVPTPAEGEHIVRVRGSDGSGAFNRFAVDTQGPAVTADPTTAPNANNWFKGPVTVHFTCADAVSGVASCPADQTLSQEGRNQSASGTATDRAGFSGSGGVSGINIDLTPPTITGTPDRPANANGWYQAPVTVTWNCADALSGVDTCDAPVTISEDQDGTANGTATDRAGNSANASLTHLRVDRTDPTVGITSRSVVVLAKVKGSAGDADTSAPVARSGIQDVVVTYTQGTTTVTRSVGNGLTLSCDSTGTDCTWSATPPSLGAWQVTAKSMDRSGRTSATAKSTLSVNP